jgi:hypothetical protein
MMEPGPEASINLGFILIRMTATKIQTHHSDTILVKRQS